MVLLLKVVARIKHDEAVAPELQLYELKQLVHIGPSSSTRRYIVDINFTSPFIWAAPKLQEKVLVK